MSDIESVARQIARCCWMALAAVVLLNNQARCNEPVIESGTFLVIDQGTALLGPQGDEIERLSSITSAAGALSPDGKWIAFSEPNKTPQQANIKCSLIIQSCRRSEERTSVPLVWGTSGSSFQPLWSNDSQRILICEQGWNDLFP